MILIFGFWLGRSLIAGISWWGRHSENESLKSPSSLSHGVLSLRWTCSMGLCWFVSLFSLKKFSSCLEVKWVHLSATPIFGPSLNYSSLSFKINNPPKILHINPPVSFLISQFLPFILLPTSLEFTQHDWLVFLFSLNSNHNVADGWIYVREKLQMYFVFVFQGLLGDLCRFSSPYPMIY